MATAFPPMKGKILVTGATGFVGGAVSRFLVEDGFDVLGTGRRKRPEDFPTRAGFQSADLSQRETVRALCEGVTGIVHAAAKAGVWGPEAEYRRANVEVTRNLLDAAKSAGVRALVFTSTPSVVFSGKPIRDGDEALPYGTDFPCAYPATKAEAERRVLAAHGEDLQTLALRPHLIWGPGDPHLFPRVFERVDAGKLKIVGDGRNRVDLTYIDNVAEGHRVALEALLQGRGGGEAYFLTQDEPVELWSFINEVLRATGRQPLQSRIGLRPAYAAGAMAEFIWRTFRLKGEPPLTRFVAKELATDHWFSSAAARKTFGYEPMVSMETGVKRYLEWLTHER